MNKILSFYTKKRFNKNIKIQKKSFFLKIYIQSISHSKFKLFRFILIMSVDLIKKIIKIIFVKILKYDPLFIKMRILTLLFRSEIKKGYVEIKNNSYNFIDTSDNKYVNISSSPDLIICGPWLSEIGFELLYWIPFLNKKLQGYENIKKVIISRGGVTDWYKHLSKVEYIELNSTKYDENLKSYKNLKLKERSQKQTYITSFEKKIIENSIKDMNINNKKIHIIHPSEFFNLFRPYFLDQSKINEFINFLYPKSYESIDKFKNYLNSDLIKEGFISMKIYSSSNFLNTLPYTNIQTFNFINQIIEDLLDKYNLILLNFDSNDDHEQIKIDLSKFKNKKYKIYFINNIFKNINYENNIDIQNFIISNSKFFIGTYGGFSYLPPLYQKKSYALITNETKVIKRHQLIQKNLFGNLEIIDLNTFIDKKIDINIFNE